MQSACRVSTSQSDISPVRHILQQTGSQINESHMILLLQDQCLSEGVKEKRNTGPVMSPSKRTIRMVNKLPE
ncbi:hypothetical protein Q7C36_001592 [Tachysurus vachellii]|uniref:Uncharacterized protein n=1 Tax=Tachysurus vachellii TaxID=175792 RepID=A0AA88TFS7_TACVA|nr:hypothetical protein Q7C36_001592 [Tachysurus vachellii]